MTLIFFPFFWPRLVSLIPLLLGWWQPLLLYRFLLSWALVTPKAVISSIRISRPKGLCAKDMDIACAQDASVQEFHGQVCTSCDATCASLTSGSHYIVVVKNKEWQWRETKIRTKGFVVTKEKMTKSRKPNSRRKFYGLRLGFWLTENKLFFSQCDKILFMSATFESSLLVSLSLSRE